MHALDYCMLLPGPEAQQLATYLGWLLHGPLGGLAAGTLFVLPGFLVMCGMALGYAVFGTNALVVAVFAGIKPVMPGVVVVAFIRLGRRVLAGPVAVGTALAGFVALALGVPFPVVVLGAAALGALFALGGVAGAPAERSHAALSYVLGDDDPPPAHARLGFVRVAAPVVVGGAVWLCGWSALTLIWGPAGWPATMAEFFTRAACVSFGGAYAALPYLWQGAVEGHGWLTGAEVVDGLALGESTPGPLILLVVWIGTLGGWKTGVLAGPAGGVSGALLGGFIAACFTFLPSFVFILAGGPLVEAGRVGRVLRRPLEGVRAATVGVIAWLAVLFGSQVIFRAGIGTLDVGALSADILTIMGMLTVDLAIHWWVLGGAGWGLAQYVFT